MNTLQDYLNYPIFDGPLKAETIKVLQGANYFSAGQVVLIRINLGIFDEVFTNQINGFYEKLSKLIPSLYEHHCSEGRPGGFFYRVETGTLLGHVIEHVAIELQSLAGMNANFGKTRSTLTQGVYNVIFRFIDEEAGIFAGKAAINLINSLLLNKGFEINPIIDGLLFIREHRLLGPSTQAIVSYAESLNIPTMRLDNYNLVQLGNGKYQKRIRATLTSETNQIAVETADNKYLSSLMLADAGIPVPKTRIAETESETLQIAKEFKQPIVIKPISGNLGKNIMLDLSSKQEIKKAFKLAKLKTDKVLIQPFLKGKIFRVLVINYKFVAASELTPPSIKGDGIHTIKELIDIENSNPLREYGDKGKLSKIPEDSITESILHRLKYDYTTILAQDEILNLKTSGNRKLGGSSTNVSEQIHPYNIFLAERTAKVIGLNVAGIDFLCQDISQPMQHNDGAILEVNAAPDFGIHLNPTIGNKVDAAKAIIEMLFPKASERRVPIFSVTGTVGKTIFVRFIDYCLRNEGYTTGLTTSEGLYINNNLIIEGDMTYPEHVKLVLKDPTIDCAILETSREGILRSGLGYKFADYGIVLNLHNDHVGSDDIKYIEDLAYAKSVVAEEVYETGYSILNADNELVIEMKERIYGTAALFSKNENNHHITDHAFRGGLVVFLRNNQIIIKYRNIETELISLDEIPLCMNGTAMMTLDSILGACATLFAHKIPSEKIIQYLKTFQPNKENLPGRLNLFNINNFKVLLDYAHNIVSFEGLNEFLRHYNCRKIGVLDAAGDRSDEEIIALGKKAGEMFDITVVYEGYDLRGREIGEITKLLISGIQQTQTTMEKIFHFETPQQAWEFGIKTAKKDDLVVLLSPRSQISLQYIETLINQK